MLNDSATTRTVASCLDNTPKIPHRAKKECCLSSWFKPHPCSQVTNIPSFPIPSLLPLPSLVHKLSPPKSGWEVDLLTKFLLWPLNKASAILVSASLIISHMNLSRKRTFLAETCMSPGDQLSNSCKTNPGLALLEPKLLTIKPLSLHLLNHLDLLSCFTAHGSRPGFEILPPAGWRWGAGLKKNRQLLHRDFLKKTSWPKTNLLLPECHKANWNSGNFHVPGRFCLTKT